MKTGNSYIQAGEQLAAPGATAHILRICGKVIAIDSGMGLRDEKLGGNYFPVKTEDYGKIDLSLLTHHHVDHSGHLAALMRDNPKAKAVMTRPAAMGAEIMMRDSLKIAKTEQGAIRRAGGTPTPFIYSEDDINNTFKRMIRIDKPGWYQIWPDWILGVYSAGHTRGAAMYFLIAPDGNVYFITGDVCSHNQPVIKGVMLPPREFFGNRLEGKRIVMITETTYGDREMSKSFNELWDEFGACVEKAVLDRISSFCPSFSDRAPNLAFELIQRGIFPHVDGMARDFVMLHADSAYSWCPQDIKFDVERFIKEKKLILYKKLTGKSPQEEHQAEARHREDTASGSCCGGINYSPIISSSAMLDKGTSVGHALRILPNRKGLTVFTGYMFDGSVGKDVLNAKKGDTVKLTAMDWTVKKEVERHVPVSCDVVRFGLSAHDTADKLVERVRLMNEICKVEAVIAHHGDDENASGFLRRVQALNLGISVFHGKHMQLIQL